MNWFWRKNKTQEKEPDISTYVITMKDGVVIHHTSENSGTIDVTNGNLYFYDENNGIELLIASGEWVSVIQKEYQE